MNRYPTRTAFTLSVVIAIISLATAQSAPFIWTGNGTDTLWSNSVNWGGSTLSNDGTATLTFSGTPASFAPTVDAGGYNINSLVIATSGSTPYTISGGTLTLSGTGAGITATRSGANVPTNVISNNIVLNNAATFSAGDGSSTAVLRLTGDISGNSAVTIGFTLGTVRLSGNNTFTGGVLQSRATLELGSDTALGTGTMTLSSVANSLVAAVGGNRTIGNTVNVVAYSGANITAIGQQTLGGNLTLSGNIILSGTTRYTRYMGVNTNSTVVMSGNITQDTSSTATHDFRLVGVFNATAVNQGTLYLNGNGSYTGVTQFGYDDATVNRAKIYVNGDYSASSNTVVYNGIILGGTGKLRSLDVRTGAVLTPGGSSSMGILHVVGGANFSTNSMLSLRIDNLGNSDGLAISGGLMTLGSSVTLSLSGTLADSSSLLTYTLATFDSTTENSYGSFSSILLNGVAWNPVDNNYKLVYGATSLTLQAVPEPPMNSLVMSCGVFLMLVLWGSKRNTKNKL